MGSRKLVRRSGTEELLPVVPTMALLHSDSVLLVHQFRASLVRYAENMCEKAHIYPGPDTSRAITSSIGMHAHLVTLSLGSTYLSTVKTFIQASFALDRSYSEPGCTIEARWAAQQRLLATLNAADSIKDTVCASLDGWATYNGNEGNSSSPSVVERRAGNAVVTLGLDPASVALAEQELVKDTAKRVESLIVRRLIEFMGFTPLYSSTCGRVIPMEGPEPPQMLESLRRVISTGWHRIPELFVVLADTLEGKVSSMDTFLRLAQRTNRWDSWELLVLHRKGHSHLICRIEPVSFTVAMHCERGENGSASTPEYIGLIEGNMKEFVHLVLVAAWNHLCEPYNRMHSQWKDRRGWLQLLMRLFEEGRACLRSRPSSPTPSRSERRGDRSPRGGDGNPGSNPGHKTGLGLGAGSQSSTREIERSEKGSSGGNEQEGSGALQHGRGGRASIVRDGTVTASIRPVAAAAAAEVGLAVPLGNLTDMPVPPRVHVGNSNSRFVVPSHRAAPALHTHIPWTPDTWSGMLWQAGSVPPSGRGSSLLHPAVGSPEQMAERIWAMDQNPAFRIPAHSAAQQQQQQQFMQQQLLHQRRIRPGATQTFPTRQHSGQSRTSTARSISAAEAPSSTWDRNTRQRVASEGESNDYDEQIELSTWELSHLLVRMLRTEHDQSNTLSRIFSFI